MSFKNFLCGALGLIGSAAAAALGGWDSALAALITIMAADYISGLIVAGVFRRSPKSESGALESRAGLKGLLRKCGILLAVLVASRLDAVLGADMARNAAVIAFIVNESISVTENLGLMGVPIPEPIKKALQALEGR